VIFLGGSSVTKEAFTQKSRLVWSTKTLPSDWSDKYPRQLQIADRKEQEPARRWIAQDPKRRPLKYHPVLQPLPASAIIVSLSSALAKPRAATGLRVTVLRGMAARHLTTPRLALIRVSGY
jgi:hypothetical protein